MRKEKALPKAFLRVRVGSEDIHYGGGLAAGAYVMKLFGDIATELTIRHDGDEGLLRAYESVEFVAPVYAGDFLEVSGEIVAVGNTSRRMAFEARKVIQAGGPLPSSAEVGAERAHRGRQGHRRERRSQGAKAVKERRSGLRHMILGSILLVLLIFVLNLCSLP